jgi:multiple sugar transport system permease protein
MKITTSSYKKQTQIWGILFLFPAVLFFVFFKYGPMLWAMGLSFTSYDMVTPPKFVGLYNYIDLIQDPIFLKTFNNTFVYIFGSIIGITVVGLGLALIINLNIVGSRFFMTGMFLTNLIPVIACCLIWKHMFHPQGLVNQILSYVGIAHINWLTDSIMAMLAIIIVTIWRFAPYFMIVYLAALLAIPKEYYEAASIDGAGIFSCFRHITLPQIAPIIFFVIVVSGLLSARIFLMPYIITKGGPGGNTRVLSMLIYETGFEYLKMGRAAAISVILFFILLLFTIIQMRIFLKSEER